MSGNRRPLFHVLYTNAAGPGGGAGFRTLTVGFPGSEEEKGRIGDWLKSLQPEPGAVLAWGCRSFRVAGVYTAALAVVDPHFGRDDHGRAGGLLAHAFLVPVPEGERPGDFGTALGTVAERFFPWNERQESHELTLHLAGCETQGDLEIPATDLAAVRLLRSALRLRLWRAAGLEETGPVGFFDTDEELLPAALLRAASVLPPRLRLKLQWAVGTAAAPAEGFLAHPARSGEREPARREAWSEWLENRLTEEPGPLARLAESWEVMSWDRLPDSAGVLPASNSGDFAGGTPVLPGRSRQEEEGAVKAKGKPSKTRPSAGATAPDPVDLDDQYQALQGWLREYVDLRTADSPAAATPFPTPVGRGPAWLVSMAPWLALAATLLAALLALATVWLVGEVRNLEAELAKRPALSEPTER